MTAVKSNRPGSRTLLMLVVLAVIVMALFLLRDSTPQAPVTSMDRQTAQPVSAAHI